MYETTIALVIGNGFDKDLGLPSSFPEFAKSDEWNHLYNSFWGMRFGNWFMDYSLLYHLKKSIRPNWFEIEEEIQKFITLHPKVSERHEHVIRREYFALCDAFCQYLKRVSKDFKANKDRLAYHLLTTLPNCPVPIVEISFNYTDPDLFLGERPKFSNIFHCTRTYVHENIYINNIIIGCEVPTDGSVNRQLSFMYKSNRLKSSNHISKTLSEARDIIFFGHSVNEIDFGYFRDFFKSVSSVSKPYKYLTFITWDEESERMIRDNISNQGISVTDLFTNLFSITFIHSSKIYIGDREETEKFKDLLFRLQTEKRRILE